MSRPSSGTSPDHHHGHYPRRRASIKIRLDALSHNLKRVREFAPNRQIMAVIKANAYGHGLLAVASHLTGNPASSGEPAEMLAVAMPEEAYALRESGITSPIVVLHGFRNLQELETFSRLDISTTVHQRSQLDCLLESALGSTMDKAIDVWLKVDTGMHRLGISPEDVDDYFGRLRNCSNVASVSVMSHFANSDDVGNSLNNKQIESFLNVTNDIDIECSMANSAAIMRLPASHFEVVRPGIMLYGSSPFADVSAAELGLQSVMQFESFLLDIKQVKAGESIGYGSTYRCEKDMQIGLVAAGYGDGYPRHAASGTPVWINGRCCDLLGRVSMDSLCIDLDDAKASIGDRVVLWGEELSVDAVARTSDTIAYELLCN
ncbi:MAG: alanine racemase, partial [Proteobacteria bacterium]|nr:alanine racemase [Pseudomonadota bacterium]